VTEPPVVEPPVVEPLRLTGVPAADVAALRGWLDADEPPPLVIETSGSTGAPKSVLLSRSAVLASAEASAARLGSAGPWALALPSSYVAGVNVVVRSLLAGHEPVVDADPTTWPEEVRFVSVVPTQLARWAADPSLHPVLARLDAVLVGGGPVDHGARGALESRGVRVVATYGSSETSGGCVYDGHPLDGVELGLTGDGRVRVAGPVLFDGYLGDPTLTGEALVDGWFVTSDLGVIHDDGRLEVVGRADDMLISGGVKVPAPAVARRLRDHPAVVAAEVVGVPDDEWGQRVVAVVASTAAPSLDELRDWVGESHPRAWAPRAVVVVDALPMLGNGKVDRAAVRALAQESA
jgi:O-succinylbenzoic acid--CoA ligase